MIAKTVFSKKFMLHIMKSIDYPALAHTTKEVRTRCSNSVQAWQQSCVVGADVLIELYRCVLRS